MFLFDGNSSYRPERVGRRDTPARFVHDLATAGVPMTLASIKAAADAVLGKPDSGRRLTTCGAEAPCRPPVRSMGPIAGLS